MRITVIATGFDREAMAVAAVGSTSTMPATAQRPMQRPMDELPRPMMSSARADDLDVPTFIRKKAD
jgi:hypothetical protein